MRDADVRKAVRIMLEQQHADDNGTRIVEEMGIWSGSVRIDVAVINGELHGFELKSAKDTLDRLPQQAALYNEVFDRVTLVVAGKHATKATECVPHWWGIYIADSAADNTVVINPTRDAQENPEIKALQLARLLWREEAISILSERELIRGFRSKGCEVLAERLAANLSRDELRDEVRRALKARSGWLRKLQTNKFQVSV